MFKLLIKVNGAVIIWINHNKKCKRSCFTFPIKTYISQDLCYTTNPFPSSLPMLVFWTES